MKTLDILKKLVSIDSNIKDSNKNLVVTIKNMLKKYKSTVYKFKKGDIELYNLIVKIPGNSSKNPLIFAMHTDTVGVNSKWSTDPFKPTIKSGKLYGLGSCDMKGGIACAISAALELKKKPENDIYLIFDADEEEGGTGIRELVKKFRTKNAKIIVTEPTSRKATIGQKGCLNIEVEFKGVSKHAARSSHNYNMKNNAIYKANKFIGKIIEYSKKLSKKKNKVFGAPTIGVNQINGGVSVNVIPDSCKVILDTRTVPEESLEKRYTEIKNIALKVDKKAKVVKIFDGGSFRTKADSVFMKSLIKKSNGLIKGTEVTKGWTEASYYQRYGDVVILGPGSMEQAHKANEFIKISELEKFKEFYKGLMLD